MNRNSLKERLVLGPATRALTLELRACDYMIFGGVVGRPLDTCFGLSQFMVTALGSCVKWPFVLIFDSSTTNYIYIYIYISQRSKN